jgi:two-component system nitrogen regulation response regulator NtrX
MRFYYSHGGGKEYNAMGETINTKSESTGGSGALIYVVDDEPMLLELATVILEPEGYQGQSFRDPELALQTFSGAPRKPDLLITDYAMHPMNGMELIEQIRCREPRQKILLISGTVGEDIFRSSPTKPDDFLAKPYQAAELTNLVKAVLKKK